MGSRKNNAGARLPRHARSPRDALKFGRIFVGLGVSREALNASTTRPTFAWIWAVALCFLSLTTLSGCVTVAAYNREYLTSPAMNAELEDGEMEFQGHVFDSREGATGGHGSTGGGCGCN